MELPCSIHISSLGTNRRQVCGHGVLDFFAVHKRHDSASVVRNHETVCARLGEDIREDKFVLAQRVANSLQRNWRRRLLVVTYRPSPAALLGKKNLVTKTADLGGRRSR